MRSYGAVQSSERVFRRSVRVHLRAAATGSCKARAVTPHGSGALASECAFSEDFMRSPARADHHRPSMSLGPGALAGSPMREGQGLRWRSPSCIRTSTARESHRRDTRVATTPATSPAVDSVTESPAPVETEAGSSTSCSPARRRRSPCTGLASAWRRRHSRPGHAPICRGVFRLSRIREPSPTSDANTPALSCSTRLPAVETREGRIEARWARQPRCGRTWRGDEMREAASR